MLINRVRVYKRSLRWRQRAGAGRIQERALVDPHNTFATRHSEAQGDSGFLFQGWTLGGQIPQDKLWESLPWRGHNLIGSSPQRRGRGRANLKCCRELQVPVRSARPVEKRFHNLACSFPLPSPRTSLRTSRKQKMPEKENRKNSLEDFLSCVFIYLFWSVCVCLWFVCASLDVHTLVGVCTCACLRLDARGRYRCLHYCFPCSFLSQGLSSG